MGGAVRAVDDPEGMPGPVVDQVFNDAHLRCRDSTDHEYSAKKHGLGQDHPEGPPCRTDDQRAHDKQVGFAAALLPAGVSRRCQNSLKNGQPHAVLQEQGHNAAENSHEGHVVVNAVNEMPLVMGHDPGEQSCLTNKGP